MVEPFDFSKIRKQRNKRLGLRAGFDDPITWIDTGNYALNKMISGHFDRGIPLGAVTVFAGESGSGKSLIVSGNIVRDALAQGCHVVILDSEDALKETWMRRLGVDTGHANLGKEVVSTIDQIAGCINEYTKFYIEQYKDTPREQQPKVLFVVDSLGVVQTQAEIDQFEKGELKGDKGIKAKTLKMLVANCIRLFSGYEIGLVATNHTYKSQDMYNPEDVISGGCLVAGTKVWLENGDHKSIENITIDDTVQTMFGVQPVTHLWKYEMPTYTLELSDGTVLTCSPDHKFLVADDVGFNWKRVEDITDSDELISL
jgi:RecA/RadA recombinase